MNSRVILPGLLNECLVTQSRIAARRLTQLYNQRLTAVDLKAQQISLMYFLYQRPELTTGELTEALAIERSAVSRNLAVLESRYYVTSDQRGRGLTRKYELTEYGESVLKSMSDAWHEAQQEVRSKVGEEGWETILKAFKLLTDLPISE